APPRSYFLSLTRRPTISTLFPYTTLFRSRPGKSHVSGPGGDEGRAAPTDRAGRSGHRTRWTVLPAPGVDRFPAQLRQGARQAGRSEEHTSELQSRENLVCRLLLEKKKKNN